MLVEFEGFVSELRVLGRGLQQVTIVQSLDDTEQAPSFFLRFLAKQDAGYQTHQKVKIQVHEK